MSQEKPTLRERQRKLTRDTILEALVDVIADDGIHEFSVQTVADRAGVSHRTVYRHFPSREELLEGFAGWLEERLKSDGFPGLPPSTEELPALAERLFHRFSEDERAYRAMVLTALVLDHQPTLREQRTQAFLDLFRERYPHLSEREALDTASVIRTLVSSRQWFLLTQELGLPAETAGRAVRRACERLLAALDREGAQG